MEESCRLTAVRLAEAESETKQLILELNIARDEVVKEIRERSLVLTEFVEERTALEDDNSKAIALIEELRGSLTEAKKEYK